MTDKPRPQSTLVNTPASRRTVLGGLGAAGLAMAVPGRVFGADAKPLKLGIDGPFTGPASRTGEAIRNGVKMALADLRKQGRLPVTVDGQSRSIEPVWIDNQSSPEKAVKAVTEAIENQGVEMMATGWHSSVAMAEMDAEAPYNIVHVGHTGESQSISEKLKADPEKYKGFFKGWTAPPIFAGLYGKPLNHFIEQGLWTPRNRKAAVVVEDSDFGRGWGKALEDNLRQAGFDPLPFDAVPLDQAEFTPLLAKYKAQDVSVVAMTSTGNTSTSNFVKQFRQQQLEALLIGHGLTWFSEWHQLTGDASNYTVSMDSMRAINQNQKDWVARYADRFGQQPSITPAGLSYDYTAMAVEALHQAGTLEFDPLVETLRNMTYKGVWNLYDFAKEPGPNALAPNEVKAGDFMEGFFFAMVQLMDGEAEVIWPLEHAETKFQQPPWIS